MISSSHELAIAPGALDAVNRLLDDDSPLVRDLRAVVARYGTPDEINTRAAQARALPALLNHLDQLGSPIAAPVSPIASERLARRVCCGGGGGPRGIRLSEAPKGGSGGPSIG